LCIPKPIFTAAYLFGAIKNTLFNFLRKKGLITVPLDSLQAYGHTESRPSDYSLTLLIFLCHAIWRTI